jgi:hypothetical protein
MKRRGVILKSVWFLGCAALTAFGVTKENQYQSIFQRNAFGLNPTPTLPAIQNEMVAPLIVKLTGVSNLGGSAKAFIQITEPGPGKLSRWSAPMTKGERLDGIEVLEIDVERGQVKIKNGSIDATLSFEKDGVKSSTAGISPLTLPSVAPGTSGVGGVIAIDHAGTPNTGSGSAGTTFITRDGQRAAIPPTARVQTYEESVLNVALNTELMRQAIEKGEHPPYPPTEFTPNSPRLPNAIDVEAQAQSRVPISSVPIQSIPPSRRTR